MTWTRVTKASPCLACGDDHWCGRGDSAIRCMKTDEPPVGFRLHKRNSDGGTVFVEVNSQPPPNSITRRKPPPPPPIDRTAEADGYLFALTPALAAELADELGLPVDGFEELGVGWCDTRSAWTFPERDAKGRVTGLVFRDRDGNKLAGRGHKRGLSIPSSFARRPDPVLGVEGPTDTLTATAMGLAAIGRPSNRAGGELLAELLAGRDVLIVGENDQKPNGDWPGRDGAQAIARDLARRWNRPVSWTMPPQDFKDIRAWYLDDETGADLLPLLQANVQVEEPGGLIDVPQANRNTGKSKGTAIEQLDKDGAWGMIHTAFALERTFRRQGVELCEVLARIYDGGGFEAAGLMHSDLYGRKHPTLGYFAKPWGITIRHVQRMIDCGRLSVKISDENVVDLPLNVSKGHLEALLPLAGCQEDVAAACRQAGVLADEEAREKGQSKPRVTAKLLKIAVRSILPPRDVGPDMMSPAAAALCVNETGKGESAREVARLVSKTWESVAAMPGAPRALVEALSMAKQLAENWARG